MGSQTRKETEQGKEKNQGESKEKREKEASSSRRNRKSTTADVSASVHPRRSRQVQSVSSLSCLPRRRAFTTQRFFASDGADLRRIIVRSQDGSPVTRLLPRYHTMAEIRPIQPKISNKSIANDRHGVSCVCFLFLRLPGPNLEQRIPRPGAQTDTVVADAEAAHTVVVAAKRTNLVPTENIPNLALEVVVSSEE